MRRRAALTLELPAGAGAFAESNRGARMRGRIACMVFAAAAASAYHASTRPAWALANPASVFCVQSGGKSEIRTGPKGQYGVCRLPNGRVVEEWSYYRKMKGKTRSSQ